jgi:hypothetical protein
MNNKKLVFGCAAFILAALVITCGGKTGGTGGTASTAKRADESPASYFQYELNEAGDGVVITKYAGPDWTEGKLDIVIPAEIEGYPVVAIGNNAFYNGDSKTSPADAIQSIVVPDTVTELLINLKNEKGDQFRRMDEVTSITLSKNIKVIPNETFAVLPELQEVNFPDGITIEDSAFYNCPKLTLAVRKRITDINPNGIE